MIEEHDVSRLDLLEIAAFHAGWQEDVDGIVDELARRRFHCPKVNNNDEVEQWSKRGRISHRDEVVV